MVGPFFSINSVLVFFFFFLLTVVTMFYRVAESVWSLGGCGLAGSGSLVVAWTRD